MFLMILSYLIIDMMSCVETLSRPVRGVKTRVRKEWSELTETELESLEISDREAASNATTAVSPLSPGSTRCDPQGPPPQRAVRSELRPEARELQRLAKQNELFFTSFSLHFEL